MKYICYLCPALISLLIYIFRYKKGKSIVKTVSYYILNVVLINFIMLIICRYSFSTNGYYFTAQFSIKYIAASSFLAFILPFFLNIIGKICGVMIKYKIFDPKDKFKNLKHFYKDYYDIINSTIFYVSFFMIFWFLDLFVRKSIYNVVPFYRVLGLAPNILAIGFCSLFIFILRILPKTLSKIYLIILYVVSIILSLVQYFMIYAKGECFTIYDLNLASEGFEFINFIFKFINLKLILFVLFILFLCVVNFFIYARYRKGIDNTKWYKNLGFLAVFIFCRFLSIAILQDYDEYDWEAVSYPRYYYDNFINPKRSLSVLGIYEYSIRDVYMYFKDKSSTFGSSEEIERLISLNSSEKKENEYTGIFKDKNVIMIMMESIDSIVVTEDVMPTLYYMMNNGFNFTGRYSSLNSGGSTIATEYTSMTGLFYLNKYQNEIGIDYSYSLPNQFKRNGYKVSSFHENSGMYYNRDSLHNLLGFNNSYFVYDIMDDYKYYDDPQFANNDYLYNLVAPKDGKFMSFIITIAAHGPYLNNNICDSYSDSLSERECFNYLAARTDSLLENLVKRLEEDNLLDDTIFILYTDHQAYSYNYTQSDLSKFKKIDSSFNIKNIPFVIYSKGMEGKRFDDILVNDIDLVPTILNLFGIEYNSDYYVGRDIFSPSHKNVILFSDYSWYDGNVYSLNDNVDKGSSYYKDVSSYVKNTIDLSHMILSNNYYKSISSGTINK